MMQEGGNFYLKNADANQNNNPLISIIIVTFNAVKQLQDCLNSIIAQKYYPIEIVIIDGGSSDGTIDLLKKNNHVINYWRSEKDDGIYDAMNKGLNYITGKWVYFLGADDTLLPDFSKMAHVLSDENTIYYGSVIMKGKKYLGYLTPYRLAKTGICHQAMIYPIFALKKYNFDTKFRISADHVLNMKCWSDKEIKLKHIDLIIANFNHTGISSLQKDPVFEREKSKLIFNHFGLIIGCRYLFKKFKAKLLNNPY